MIFVALCSSSSKSHAENEIVNLLAPACVDTEYAIDMLLFKRDWPDGAPVVRVHFQEDSPQARLWARSVGVTPYYLQQKERRHIALGGQPAVRVKNDGEMAEVVAGDARAVGYTVLHVLYPTVRYLCQHFSRDWCVHEAEREPSTERADNDD